MVTNPPRAQLCGFVLQMPDNQAIKIFRKNDQAIKNFIKNDQEIKDDFRQSKFLIPFVNVSVGGKIRVPYFGRVTNSRQLYFLQLFRSILISSGKKMQWSRIRHPSEIR